MMSRLMIIATRSAVLGVPDFNDDKSITYYAQYGCRVGFFTWQSILAVNVNLLFRVGWVKKFASSAEFVGSPQYMHVI